MSNARTRIGAGIVLGIVLGALGPVLRAVAFHTGNQSGNQPLSASAAAPARQGGDALWVLGYDTLRYRFEVVLESTGSAHIDPARQEAGRSETGEAVATVETCEPFGRNCVRTSTWRATLGSPYTEGSTFIADPTLTQASFRGWLRDDATGAACLFEVGWGSSSAPDPSAHHGAEAGPHGGNASAGARTSRRVDFASVEAPCWSADGTAEFGDGDGTLFSEQGAGATGAHILESLHPMPVPYPCPPRPPRPPVICG